MIGEYVWNVISKGSPSMTFLRQKAALDVLYQNFFPMQIPTNLKMKNIGFRARLG